MAFAPEPDTFAGQWTRAVVAHGDRTFLRFESPSSEVFEWTYAEFDDVVSRVATNLRMRGVGRDRGVQLALTNSPAFVLTWLATVRLGSYVVPSDPMSTAPELAEHLGRTSIAVLVAAEERSAVAQAAVGEHGGAADLVLVDEAEAVPEPLVRNGGLCARNKAWPCPRPAQTAAIMFTSGTTGRPKGVVITQANYAFAGSTMAAASGLTVDDRQLVVLPMFHANAQYYSFASAIAVGAGVALMHTFSASGFVAQAARHRATHASLFAGPMRMILARGSRPSEAIRRDLVLRHCWYAQNITGEQYETLADWLGCRPRQLYGMTETIPAVLTDEAVAPRPDAMGYVTDGCIVDVQDADGSSCGPDEVGEIVVGGEPGRTLFASYLDDPATTAASFRDGWFLTGDRARRDAEGRFFFDGRRSDVLKVAGENVSVVEVETVIADHDDVFDVVVVGAPDEIRDEVPVAYVVARPAVDTESLTDRLGEWCAARLGKAKRPRSFTLVDELPRTSVGKVRKFLLVEAAAGQTSTIISHSPQSPRTESPA